MTSDERATSTLSPSDPSASHESLEERQKNLILKLNSTLLKIHWISKLDYQNLLA